MGYYTNYSIKLLNGEEITEEVQAEIAAISGYANLFEGTVKWYDHIDNMKEFSKKHPSEVFVLSGIGEEPRDEWVKYYKNGKVHEAEVEIKKTVETFDPKKLK